MRHLVPVSHLPRALAAVLISLGSVLGGWAGAADQTRGAACATIDDPAARLACFDAAFPRPPRAAAQVAAPAAEAAAAAQKFGLSARQKEALEPKPAQPPATATTAIVSTERKLPSGYLLIGLDNDQLWQQTEIDSNIHLRPGDRVRIRQASLGSYLLDTPAGFSTRVRRLK